MGSDTCKFEQGLNKLNQEFPACNLWPQFPPLPQLFSETFGRAVLFHGPWVEDLFTGT
jgi:hypothetical protein